MRHDRERLANDLAGIVGKRVVAANIGDESAIGVRFDDNSTVVILARIATTRSGSAPTLSCEWWQPEPSGEASVNIR